MKRPLFIGYEAHPGYGDRWKRGERLEIDGDALVRHAFICGATGSGKTVFAKGVVEEALLAGVPVIAVDIKGDIASMALHQGLLDQGAAETLFGDKAAGLTRQYRDGLAGQGAVADRAELFSRQVEPRLFTPRSSRARRLALSMLPSFDTPPADEVEREDRRSLIRSMVNGLGVRMYGRNLTRYLARLTLLEELAGWCSDQGQPLEGTDGLKTLLHLVDEPPMDEVGGLPMDDFLGPGERRGLRQSLATQAAGANQDAFLGEALTVETLVGGAAPGRTPLSIIYLGHMADFHDQAFCIAQICTAIYRWMRRRGGSNALELLLYIDEVGGGSAQTSFYPSHPYNPPSKSSLSLLVKQGRSNGVGVLLATQNPVSVDIQALGNVGTWAAGRLTRPNDLARVQPVFDGPGVSMPRVREALATAPTHHFLVQTPDGQRPRWVHERWLSSVHRALTPDEVQRLHALLERTPATAVTPSRRARVVPPKPPEPVTPPPDPSWVDDAARTGATAATRPTGQATGHTAPTRASRDLRWVLRGQGQETFVEPGSAVTVGRSRDCDVTFKQDDRISREHCRLRVDEAVLVLEPLREGNPPLLNDEAVTESRALDPASAPYRLRLGKTDLELDVADGG